MKRFKSIFTTFIGTALIGVCLYFVYTNKANFAEVAGFVTIGIALLFSDDKAFAENFLPFIFKKSNSKNEGVG